MKPLIYIQEVDSNYNFIVCINATKEQFSRWVKRSVKSKEYSSYLIRQSSSAKENVVIKDNQGGITLFINQTYKDTWSFWLTLMHEIHHIVHFIAENRMQANEYECQAYLFEDLFIKIKDKIKKHYK